MQSLLVSCSLNETQMSTLPMDDFSLVEECESQYRGRPIGVQPGEGWWCNEGCGPSILLRLLAPSGQLKYFLFFCPLFIVQSLYMLHSPHAGIAGHHNWEGPCGLIVGVVIYEFFIGRWTEKQQRKDPTLQCLLWFYYKKKIFFLNPDVFFLLFFKREISCCLLSAYQWLHKPHPAKTTAFYQGFETITLSQDVFSMISIYIFL